MSGLRRAARRVVASLAHRLAEPEAAAPVETSDFPPLSPVAVSILAAVGARGAAGGPPLRLVQIGANPSPNDPIQPFFDLFGSDIRMLLIEAHPAAFERLSEMYGTDPRISLVQALVGSPGDRLYALRPEWEPSYQQVKGRPADRISSGEFEFVASRVAKRLGLDDDQVREAIAPIETPVRSLEDICDEHGFTTFDVLQVDAEGKDADIIRGLDPERFGFTILNFESAWLEDRGRSLVEHLKGFGFALVSEGGDALYLRAWGASS